MGKNGFSIIDTYLAISFKCIEESSQISKYAFVYMAQPLSSGVPAFPLACIGNDNKLSADVLSRRWSQIVTECQNRGFTVLSFGTDGVQEKTCNYQENCLLILPHII